MLCPVCGLTAHRLMWLERVPASILNGGFAAMTFVLRVLTRLPREVS